MSTNALPPLVALEFFRRLIEVVIQANRILKKFFEYFRFAKIEWKDIC